MTKAKGASSKGLGYPLGIDPRMSAYDSESELDKVLMPFFRQHLPWKELLYDELKTAIQALVEEALGEDEDSEPTVITDDLPFECTATDIRIKKSKIEMNFVPTSAPGSCGRGW